MQDLVDYVDDIPSLMKTANKSVTRLHVMEPNSSYSVSYTMRGNAPIDVTDRSNALQVERMTNHAKRAMTNVAMFPSDYARPRSVQESSTVAMEKFSKLKDSGMDINKLYSQYDVNRNGKISYKEFGDSLIAVSSGLGKDETQLLAAQLDTKKVGSINYKDMLANLQEISSQLESSHNNTKKVGSINYKDILASLQDTQPLVTTTERKSTSKPSVTSQALDVYSENQTDDWTNLSSVSAPPPVVVAPVIVDAATGSQVIVSEGNGYLANYNSMLATQSVNDDSCYLSTFDRSSKPLSSVLRSKAQQGAFTPNRVTPNTSLIVVPQSDVVNVQLLDADVPEYGRGGGNRSVCSDVSYQEEWPMSGRRMYAGTRHRSIISPYYVDPTPMEAKEERKRSQSAPPRARSLRLVEETAAELSPTNSTPSTPFRNSLRASLLKTANASDFDDSVSVTSSVKSTPGFLSKRELVERRETMTQKLKDIESKTTENGIVDQLGGRLNQFRHVLKQQDNSQSGSVNKEEFHTALRKSGVILTKTQVSDLYETLAKENSHPSIMGYSNNKALNIESFVNRIQARTVAPAFSHLNAVPADNRDDDTHSIASSRSASHAHHHVGVETVAERAARAEELRIVKKVLHHANKNHNPHGVFQQIDKNHVGWIGVSELKDALDHLNTNLSASEYNVLLAKVDKTSDGKIDLTNFEKVLHCTVTENDKRDTQLRQQTLRDSKFYNATYQSSKDLTTYDLPEYETLSKSPSYRKEQMSWNKLKSVFQTSQRQVLAAFVPEQHNKHDILYNYKHGKGPDTTACTEMEHVQPVTVNELQHNLERVGVRLGSEDVNQLRQRLFRKMEQPTPANVNLTKEQRVSKDATVSLEDFCSLMNIDVNVNHRDTVELRNPRETQADGGIFASSRKSQIANPTLSTSLFIGENNDVFNERRKKIPQTQYLHTSDPSKFWEFTQSSAIDVLYPQPMASLREPFPDKRAHLLEKKAATRGLIVPDTGRVQAELIKTGMVVQENEVVKDRRRSVSVPRNASRSATFVPSEQVVRQVNTSLNVSNSLDQSMNAGLFSSKTSDHISKWASSSLADYFDSKSKQHKTPTSAAPQTLRRVVQQSSHSRAPYATDQ